MSVSAWGDAAITADVKTHRGSFLRFAGLLASSAALHVHEVTNGPKNFSKSDKFAIVTHLGHCVAVFQASISKQFVEFSWWSVNLWF